MKIWRSCHFKQSVIVVTFKLLAQRHTYIHTYMYRYPRDVVLTWQNYRQLEPARWDKKWTLTASVWNCKALRRIAKQGVTCHVLRVVFYFIIIVSEPQKTQTHTNTERREREHARKDPFPKHYQLPAKSSLSLSSLKHITATTHTFMRLHEPRHTIYIPLATTSDPYK